MPRRAENPKVERLRAERWLNPCSEAAHDERFRGSGFFDPRDLVQVKYEMNRWTQVDGEPVAHAAEAFGFSRLSFYAAAPALYEDGLVGLVPARPARVGVTS